MHDEHLVVAAGGTGGHLYPALAVAERFRDLLEGARVTFIGTERGLESRIVPKAGFPLEYVRAQPLRGGSVVSLKKMKGVLGLLQGMIDARRLLKKLRPSVVMGLGAYVSGTVLLTAALRGIPTLILEPNAEPGLANKWLGPFIDEAALAWEETTRHFGAKAVVTGNPVRQAIVDVALLTEEAQGPVMRVLLFGGSQGSSILNRAMTDSLPLLAGVSERLHVVHQTGPSDFERVRRAYEERPVNGRVTPYIDAMDEAYATSDLVVSRAGAMTCAELAASGRPALLVPLPLAGGHQEANANLLERAGAARSIRQSELTPERLAQELVSLLGAPEKRLVMAAAARALARPDAAKRVAERLVGLSGGAGGAGGAAT